MSNHHHRNVSRRPRTAVQRTAPVNLTAAEPASAEAASLSGTELNQVEAAAAPAAQVSESQPAALDREAVVEAHFQRISALLRQAEAVAEAMLASLLQKVQRRETVYPGELIHICRGLHVLAACTTELGRTGRKAAAGTLTTSQVERLEARLRKSFGM